MTSQTGGQPASDSTPRTPRVWLVRAGRQGEDEAAAIENNLAIIGFTDVQSLEDAADKDAMSERLRQSNPAAREKTIINRAAQLAAFVLRMRDGDIVALPLKTRPGQVALGRVEGPYAYTEIGDARRHARPVKWVRPDVARSEFGQDLIHSLGAFMTICRIQRNQAERRIAAILAGKPDPDSDTPEEPTAVDTENVQELQEPEAETDIREIAHQEILDHIRARFPGHDFARLVEAALQAEGYFTRLSPPGPDGGVDILAGRGPIGFETPRICVQVKATAAALNVDVLRSLQGAMQSFHADQGLLVSWGGFTGPLIQEARRCFFNVRLWNANDLAEAIYDNYERLPKQIQAEIPLERVWTLVHDEDGP